MPKTKLPKGTWFQKKRLAGGEVVRYGYLGRGPGMISLGREGTPEFFANLADAQRREPPSGTIANLIWAYRQSKKYAALRPRTRADYARQLDRIKDKFGTLSLAAISSRAIIQHLRAWHESMAESPRQADYALQVLKALLAWGVKQGRLETNRAAGIEHLYRGDRSENVWTPAHVAAFLKVAPEPLKRALILAIETGQSQEDLLVMPWSAVRGDIVVSKRLKTNVPVAVPISPELRACLQAAPKGLATTILTRADGLPWDPKGNGFRAAWRDACKRAGVTGLHFNDLRGTFITRRREAGWTEEEVALCSGHPMSKRGAFHAYVDRQAVAIANAQRLAETRYGAKPEQKLQTGLQTAPEGQELSA